ncbi:hypothetical protein NND39_02645 [Streptococcus mutans]|uniref:hypothetical protein n=1 Tax=Streptococcus mutans TaxID=1309 RepID=UPI0028ECF111|nr:hypothetical protein [Streptococcus mutans]MDT9506682.1 hypothetical protein [Streptococcus mutans]
MDQWEVICSKVSGLEEELAELEEQYYKDQQVIEKERILYEERYQQFRTFLEAKYEGITAGLNQREVQDCQSLTNLTEGCLLIGEQQLMSAFQIYDQRLEDLEAAYKKKWLAKDEQLTAAYVERSRIDLELLDEGK